MGFVSTECVVGDILDVDRFRRDFMFGIVLQYAKRDKDFREAVTSWEFSDARPATEAEAYEILTKRLRGNISDEAVSDQLLFHLSNQEVRIGLRFGLRQIAMAPLDDESAPYDEVSDRLSLISSTASYVRLQLPGPIASVRRIRIVVNGVTQGTLPASAWQVSDSRQGVVQISSGGWAAENSARFVPTGDDGNLFASSLRFLRPPTVPSVYAVDYTAGVADGKVPLALLYTVWCDAARFLLSLNSTILTKGISSQSRTVDGISNNISLTNTAMYDINSALELIVKDYAEKMSPTVLARKMRGITVRRFG